LQSGSLRVLDPLSGEGTSGTQNTALTAGGLFGQSMDGQMAAWRAGDRGGSVSEGAALGYAPEASNDAPEAAFNAVLKAPAMAQPRWSAWGSGFGAGQSLKGDTATGSATFADRAAGGAIGVDHLVNPNLMFGVAVGGSSATFSVSDRATSGRVEGGHVGAYAMQRFGDGYLSMLASYGHFTNDTTRTISSVGLEEIAKGTFGSDQFGGRMEIGRTWGFGRFAVTPFAAVQASQLRQAAYTENSVAGSAPGVLGLSYRAIAVTSLPSFVGAEFNGRFDFGNGMTWAPFVRTAWVHEFRPTRAISASLVTIPSQSFVVEGARAASDAVKVDLGSRLVLNHWSELSTRVTGEFSNRGQSYAGSGALKVSW
jgi:outer membrane autotransporter protein